MKIDGTKTLLTGATGGIGAAIARALAARGTKLVLTGRRTDVLEPLAKELGGRAVAADLSANADVERLIAESGDVDVLIANAALPAMGLIDDFTSEEIDRALAVNLRAPILMARAIGQKMAGRKRGHIVFIGSLAGKSASPRASLYNATKFGLRGFSLALREDLAESGVGVSHVLPGFIRDAGMFADSGVKLPSGVRTSSPEEVAAGVVAAIEKDIGELSVAPVELRIGAAIGGLAPELSAKLQRMIGGTQFSKDMAEGQRNKR